MPITIDVKPLGPVNPYFGAGIATNTDSTGETNGMLSGRIDVRLMKNLRAATSKPQWCCIINSKSPDHHCSADCAQGVADFNEILVGIKLLAYRNWRRFHNRIEGPDAIGQGVVGGAGCEPLEFRH